MAGEMMLFMDPPRHTRYRKLVNRGFTPRMIAALEEHLRELTVAHRRRGHRQGRVRLRRRRGRRAAARGHRRAARRAPARTATSSSTGRTAWSAPTTPSTGSADDEVTDAQVEMFMYAQALAERAARRPAARHRDHAAQRRGRRRPLTEMDFNLFFMLLSVAGNETTRNAIAHGMNAFLENPDQWALLVSDPDRPHRRRGRGDPALGVAGHVLPPQRHPRHRARRPADPRGREDQPLVHLGQPRRVGVRRAVPVRHHPRPQPAHRLRRRRPALLPGRPAGPAGDQAAVRGAGRAGCRVLEALGEPDRLRSNFIGGIKHLPVRLAPA